MGLLTKPEEILAIDDRRFVEVEVPEWGGSVRLAEMSAKQREDYHVLFKTVATERRLSLFAFLVAACAVDEAGDPVFAPEHIERLGKKSAHVIERLFQAASDLNVLTAKSAEEQRGN